MLPNNLVVKALQGETIDFKEFGNLNPAPNLLDENVNCMGWSSKVFSDAAWKKISSAMANLEQNPKWIYELVARICHYQHPLYVNLVCTGTI